jgi:hypothetical protein
MRIARVSEHYDPAGRRHWSYLLVPTECDENRRLWEFRPDAGLELKFLVDDAEQLDPGDYEVVIERVGETLSFGGS